MLLEPNRTPYDLHFQLLGIPVRIHPGFWIAGVLLGYAGSSSHAVVELLLFVGILFVSIMVHEFGHALLMRRFGYSSQVVLYHFGGLAIREGGFRFRKEGNIHTPARTTPRTDTASSILISLAGPGAGFVLAALVVAAVFAVGGFVEFTPHEFPDAMPWQIGLPRSAGRYAGFVAFNLLYVNIFWGLVNLLPVLPLDGGQVARDLLAHRDRYNGPVQALQISIVVGVIVAAALWLNMRDHNGALMFAMLAASNFLSLQQLGRNW